MICVRSAIPGCLFEDLADARRDLPGAVEARCVRHDDRGHHIALVLVRHEARRQRLEEVEDERDERGKKDERDRHSPDDQHDQAAERLGQTVECPVEPGEGAARRRGRVPEENAAQRRSQRQRDETGDGHRDRDGDRELLVELARRAGQEGGRDEDRGHDQDGRDHGAHHLAHGLDRRLLRGEVPLGHVPLDVLHHHDRIVDDDADREHEAEEREQVDGEAEGEHDGERAEQAPRRRRSNR